MPKYMTDRCWLVVHGCGVQLTLLGQHCGASTAQSRSRPCVQVEAPEQSQLCNDHHSEVNTALQLAAQL
jgi:hypothetical protein